MKQDRQQVVKGLPPSRGGLDARGDLDAIRNRLTLVRVDSLLMYESPHQDHVAEIVESLEKTEKLVNPVIVDTDLKLVIDGHHRVEAFRALGLKQIPAYVVDYWSDVVDVRRLSLATMAKPEEIRKAFLGPAIQSSEGWSVVAIDFHSDIVARRYFKGPLLSAQNLEFIAYYLSRRKLTSTLEPALARMRSGQINSYVEPTIGKYEVFEAAHSGRLFPREVNRHLIQGRPLGMDTPLAVLSGAFQDHVDHLFACRSPELADPGTRHNGRLYEERVTLFKPDAHRP